jgi:hypothetical protein
VVHNLPLGNKSTGSLLHYAARPISWNELHDNKDTFAAASNQEQIVRVEESKEVRNNKTSIGKAWRDKKVFVMVLLSIANNRFLRFHAVSTTDRAGRSLIIKMTYQSRED